MPRATVTYSIDDLRRDWEYEVRRRVRRGAAQAMAQRTATEMAGLYRSFGPPRMPPLRLDFCGLCGKAKVYLPMGGVATVGCCCAHMSNEEKAEMARERRSRTIDSRERRSRTIDRMVEFSRMYGMSPPRRRSTQLDFDWGI
jgi:hypothetical protein